MADTKNVGSDPASSIYGALHEPLVERFGSPVRSPGASGASCTRFIQGIEQLSCTTRDDCKLGGYALRTTNPRGSLLMALSNAMVADSLG